MGKIFSLFLECVLLLFCENRILMRGIHNPVMEIVSADVSAQGLYKCEGRNRFGVQEVMFEVKIFGEFFQRACCSCM